MAHLSAKRALAALVPAEGRRVAVEAPSFTARERRWIPITDTPFLVCIVAVAAFVPAQRELDPLACLLLVGAYAVSCSVNIALADRGDAPSTQLVFVPMLFLAPLNLVPAMVLAGNLVDGLWRHVNADWPLARSVLAVGNSSFAIAPVLVLAVAGNPEFAWDYWPIYVAALAAQLISNVLISVVRERLVIGAWLDPESIRSPIAIDVVLSVPALGVVAIAGDAPVAAALMVAALLAMATGFTSERSRRLAERARAAEDARRGLVDERVRIARELHDVVAHHVSVIGVQAGAARLVLDRDPPKAKETLASIESSSRQAVHELHQLLGVLRQEGDPDDLGPQPGLGHLHELTAAMSEAQIAVEVRIEGEPYDLAPTIDASAFRIVQEALTNTLKHADASRVDVRLRYLPDELEIEVADDGEGTPGPSTSGGLGLVGMRERATLHGGRLTAGPRPSGGFMVRATLPVPGGMR